MTEKSSQPTSSQTSEEVTRIREIIFGSQMREYQQVFEAVQRDLERLQQELDRLSDQLGEQDRAQSKKLQDLRRDVRQAEGALRDELRGTAHALNTEKVDRRALGELFIQMGTQLQSGGSLSDLLQGLIEAEKT